MKNESPTLPVRSFKPEEIRGQYLTFRLHSEEYGVHITRIREIMAIQDITPLPKMPAFIRGVINLRGRIIPIVDLRIQLGLPPTEYSNTTCIVVVQIDRGYDGMPALIGCIVDSVSEVLTIESSMIEAPPRLVAAQRVGTLMGLGKVGDPARVVALLDIDSILDAAEILEAAGASPDVASTGCAS